MNKIRVVIADDNKYFADALADSLKQNCAIEIIKKCYLLTDLKKIVESVIFDVLLLDVNFNGENALEFLKKLNIKKSIKIIAITTLNNEFIKNEAMQSGVHQFIGKDSNLTLLPSIIENIMLTSNNINKPTAKKKFIFDDNSITDRKIEILRSLYKYAHLTEEELALKLNISLVTLKTHKQELFALTNTKNVASLLKFGIKKGLILP